MLGSRIRPDRPARGTREDSGVGVSVGVGIAVSVSGGKGVKVGSKVEVASGGLTMPADGGSVVELQATDRKLAVISTCRKKQREQ